jgi:ABC-type glutathione transport system ATPase component
MSSSIGDPIIEVANLTKHFSAASGVFSRSGGVVHAVEDVTLSVRRGETLG